MNKIGALFFIAMNQFMMAMQPVILTCFFYLFILQCFYTMIFLTKSSKRKGIIFKRIK